MLGGDAWKTQSIGKLGMIQSRSHQSLKALQAAVQMSLQIPQVATVGVGLFNTDLVEALTRAYHQRLNDGSRNRGGGHFCQDLTAPDYQCANELLKGKIEKDGESQS